MHLPDRTPLGVALARTAKVATAAFDDAMSRAGGSMSVWLILLALETGTATSQRELAEAVGIQGATLTHHLNGMEAEGLVTRRRDPENRRVHIVELTRSGRALFERLIEVAIAYDKRLRNGLTEVEVQAFTRVLDRLAENVGGAPRAGSS